MLYIQLQNEFYSGIVASFPNITCDSILRYSNLFITFYCSPFHLMREFQYPFAFLTLCSFHCTLGSFIIAKCPLASHPHSICAAFSIMCMVRFGMFDSVGTGSFYPRIKEYPVCVHAKEFSLYVVSGFRLLLPPIPQF